MSLRQILLVLKREYLTKVKSKAFILTTILLPLGIAAFIAVMVAISVWDTETIHNIGIVDETGTLYSRFEKLNEQRYRDMTGVPIDSLRTMIIKEQIEGYIVLTEENIEGNRNAELVYGGSGGISLLNSVESDVRDVIREVRLERANVSDEVKKIYESRPDLDTRKLTKEGVETEDDTGFLSIVGLLMGAIIFGGLAGYGGLLTRSVIEEKTNRIIEVIASSVKPIELLFGKMAGIGALAVTQLGIWIVAFLGLSAAAAPVAGMLMEAQMENLPQQTGQSVESVPFQIPTLEPYLIIMFVVFFICGYLIYSSLFAAVGSAVDSETDTQQFMFPIMIPIMIAYFLLFRIMEAPDTTVAVVSSLVPFFSPILMITRIAITDVPFWQIGLSIALMLGTFLATMWLSAKIYSVGILSYGRSANFRELLKWIREG